MLQRFFMILRKEFLHLLADQLSLQLLIVLPIAQLLLIGPALNKEIKYIPIAIYNADLSPASMSLTARFSHHERFHVTARSNSPQELIQTIRTGSALIGLQIPKGFAQELENSLSDDMPDTARLQMILDGQDVSTAQIAAGYAQNVIQLWTFEQLGQQPASLFAITVYNPELISSWYMVPGIAAMLVTMVIALVSCFSLVHERETGTLEQLLVTPVGLGQVLLGKLLPYWFVGALEFLFAIEVARLFFGIPLTGTFTVLLLLVVAYSLSSVALGLAIGTLVKSRQQALFLIYFLMVFFILTSGFLMPIEGMPQWTQTLTYGNATRHFLLAVREILLRGATIQDLSVEFSWILGIATVLIGFAWWKFDRQAD